MGFVYLDWQIAQRVNNEVYTIQRSADSRTFEEIDFVRSENRDKYEWIDKSPLQGVSYYRLKRQDDKGNIEYSQIEAVNLLDNIQEGMTVVPNPSNGEAILIVLQDKPQEKAMLSVVDITGKAIYESAFNTDTNGTTNIQIRKILAKGVYIAQIRTANKIYQEKIVVR